MAKGKTDGKYSIIIFMIHIILAKVFISAPMLYARHSAGAGWIEVLLSGIFELLTTGIILKLLEGFENRSILEIAEKSFGKTGKVVIGSAATAVFVLNSAAIYRCFCEMIRNCILQNFSYEFISVFLLAAITVSAYLGLKSQMRLNNLIFLLIAAALVLTVLVNINHYDVKNIAPLMGNGFDKMIYNAVLRNSSFFEIGALFIILPFFKRKTGVKSICFTVLSISTVLLSGITLLYQLAIPYEASGEFELPLYQLTRMLRAGSFLQRIEPLNMLVWSGAFFIYLGFGLWLSSHMFSQTFSLRSEKPVVFIFAEIICILALIPGSETTVERIYDFILSYAYIAYPVIPIAVLIAAIPAYRRKRGRAS